MRKHRHYFSYQCFMLQVHGLNIRSSVLLSMEIANLQRFVFLSALPTTLFSQEGTLLICILCNDITLCAGECVDQSRSCGNRALRYSTNRYADWWFFFKSRVRYWPINKMGIPTLWKNPN